MSYTVQNLKAQTHSLIGAVEAGGWWEKSSFRFSLFNTGQLDAIDITWLAKGHFCRQREATKESLVANW